MEHVLNAISTVGFPIVAFILMWYQSTKTIKQNTEILKELTIAVNSCIKRK